MWLSVPLQWIPLYKQRNRELSSQHVVGRKFDRSESLLSFSIVASGKLFLVQAPICWVTLLITFQPVVFKPTYLQGLGFHFLFPCNIGRQGIFGRVASWACWGELITKIFSGSGFQLNKSWDRTKNFLNTSNFQVSVSPRAEGTASWVWSTLKTL